MPNGTSPFRACFPGRGRRFRGAQAALMASLAGMVVVVIMMGCAAVGRPIPTAAGGVLLSSKGRAEGRLVVSPGATTKFSLSNAGPGKAEFDIRTLSGAELSNGPLTAASVTVTPIETTTLVIVLEARTLPGDPAGGTKIGYEIEGPAPDITWDLSRAMR